MTSLTQQKSPNFSALPALAALLLGGSNLAVHAASNDGDLFLGFRATGGTGASIDYLVDIGPASKFATGGTAVTGSPVTLSIGNISTDLAATFGSTWYTRTDLNWSISGTQINGTGTFPDNTIFASRPEATPGTRSSAWLRLSIALANTTAGYVQSMQQQYDFGSTSNFSGTVTSGDQVISTHNSAALFQPTGETNSFAYYEPGGPGTTATQSYSAFTGSTTVGGIEGAFSISGATGTVQDIYELDPQSNSPKTASTLLGGFQLDNSGVLKFSSDVTKLTVAPEPTSMSYLVLLAASFLGWGRLRSNRKGFASR